MSAVSIAPPGTFTAEVLQALLAGRGDGLIAESCAQTRGKLEVARVCRSLVTALSEVDVGQALLRVGQDLSAAVRPSTVVGRLTLAPRAPLRTRMLIENVGVAAAFTASGAPIPISNASFSVGTQLDPRRVATIVAQTQELAQTELPGALSLLRNDMVAAVTACVDARFLSSEPDDGIAPAGIGHGQPTFTSSGSTVAALDADVQVVLNAAIDLGMTLGSAVWVGHPRWAAKTGLLRDGAGGLAYPGLSARGASSFAGLPLLTSASAFSQHSPSEHRLLLISQDQILIADEDEALVATSTNADLQMVTGPTIAAQPMVPMWQSGLVALRIEKLLNWATRRTGAVVVLDGLV